MILDRRTFLVGLPLAACAAARAPETQLSPRRQAEADLSALCAGLGKDNFLGVAAVDTGSGLRILYAQDRRFAMASTFKAALAAAILVEVDAGRMRLSDALPFGSSDLTSYAPVARERLADGRMSVEQALAAIVEVSDNVAANLLLRRIGGPAGFTAFVRRMGDTVTRLDRYEEELNSNLPDDPRDTTTPAAMARLMQRLLTGNVLSPASRQRLQGWMVSSRTGLGRIRAGVPADWRTGDKTGNGARGAANDVAITWPPGRQPIVIASYLNGAPLTREQRDAVHAQVGRIVARGFA